LIVNDSPTRETVSVKFSPTGRVHTFLLLDATLADRPEVGRSVVVTGPDAATFGTVVRSIPDIVARKPVGGDADVVRAASHSDIVLRLKHAERERQAYRFCQVRIRERRLEMKLTRVEQLFDGSKLVFYFTAEGRVDFRELVRDLAAEYRLRIELRQIGARDEARMLGGYGPCGRPLCCTTWLTSFEPVSIKMAKQQHLSLSPSKLSGMCGRLKCCLRFELPNGKGELQGGCAHEGACEGGCNGADCDNGSCSGNCRSSS
jgi:cell fate regulator YaaT (PSP1 superfamily)